MNLAGSIGRVGALAVALGVGAAVATGQGLAHAQPSDTGSSATDSSSSTGDSSSTDSSSSNTSDSPGSAESSVDSPSDDSGSQSAPSGPTEPETTGDSSAGDNSAGAGDDGAAVDGADGPDTDTTLETIPGDDEVAVTDVEDDQGASPAPAVPETSEQDAVAPRRSSSDQPDAPAVSVGSPESDAPDEEGPKPRGTDVELAPALVSQAVADAELTATADEPAVAAPTAAASMQRNSVSVAASDESAPPAPLTSIITTVTSFVSAALAPLLAPLFPASPGEEPALWALLGWVRRQLFNQNPTMKPELLYQDADDGQVHGTFGGYDFDGDPLTYTVPTSGVGAPTQGTVTIDQATGTWTYTPNAGWTPDTPISDSFVVTVSDDSYPHINLLNPFGRPAPETVGVSVGAPGSSPDFTVDSIDHETGVVSGSVHVGNENGSVTYGIGNPPDPDLGTVSVDSATGAWVFTPTAEARRDAFLTPGQQTVAFTIVAVDSQPAASAAESTTSGDVQPGVPAAVVAVSVPIVPGAPPVDTLIDFRTLADGLVSVPGWILTRIGVGSVLPTVRDGAMVSDATGTAPAATYLSSALSDLSRIVYGVAGFTVDDTGTDGSSFVVALWEYPMPSGNYTGGSVQRSSTHIYFTSTGYVVQKYTTENNEAATNLYFHAYDQPISGAENVHNVSWSLDTATNALTVVDADGVATVHTLPGGDPRLTEWPGYYASAEIYETNPSTDRDIRIIYFGADSVIGGRDT